MDPVIAVVSVASWGRVFAESAIVAILAAAGCLNSMGQGKP
jgi:hypothetical protein